MTHPRCPLLAARLRAALLFLALGARGQAQSPPVSLVTIDSVSVRPVLEKLWKDSVRENRELVACLGGTHDGDTFEVRRAVPLESLVSLPDSARGAPEAGSDSVSVGSLLTTLSIETCKPPDWVGTVHTHSSRVEDLRLPKLSPYDRTVVSMWHERWRHESVFCVLYDEALPPFCDYREGA